MVTLNIGKGVYTVRTVLDDVVLSRVMELMEEVCGDVKGDSQEDLLVMGCLRLAYGLDEVSEKLKMIAENIG